MVRYETKKKNTQMKWSSSSFMTILENPKICIYRFTKEITVFLFFSLYLSEPNYLYLIDTWNALK